MVALACIAGPGSRLTVSAQVGRFYVTNPVASPISLTRIYPLSDAELSGATSQQSKWAAGIPWRLPLGWMGGTYPFDYSLDGPSGAEIVYAGRSGLVPPFYEYIEWLNPTEGSHEFTVTCIDQADATSEVTFTLVVYDENNTTHIGWVNPGHASTDDTNSGARTAPWETINGWYEGSLANSDHADKVIFYEDTGGSPTGINIGGVSGVSYSTNNSRMRMGSGKPKVHHAVSEFLIHGNGANITFEADAAWTFSGPFIHDDAGVDEVGGGVGLRAQWFRGAIAGGYIGMGYTATGGEYTIAEGSNSSFFEFPGGATDGAFFPNVILTDVQTVGEGFAGIKNNNASGVLCTGWEVDTVDYCQIFHHKGGADIERTEERGCIAIDAITHSQFRNVQWINDPVSRDLNTWCWNNYDVTSAINFTGGIEWTGDPADSFTNQASWRNNERLEHIRVGGENGDLTLTRNVRIHDGSQTNGIDDGFGMTVSRSNEYVSSTAGDLDATTNLLTGTARTNQLGLAGCEMVEA